MKYKKIGPGGGTPILDLSIDHSAVKFYKLTLSGERREEAVSSTFITKVSLGSGGLQTSVLDAR